MNHARIPISKKSPRAAGHDPVERLPVSRKLSGIMIAQALSPARRWLMAALSRPLNLLEAAVLALVLVAIGTVYCQVYCLLALQKMHGDSMPLTASLGRASADVLSAFLVFEIGKRALSLPRLARWLALPAIFTGGIALGLLIRMQVHAMSSELTARHMAVDRIPFMLLAAAALIYYWLRAAHAMNNDPWNPGDERDRIPPAKAIDWVRAAGNYVEIRVAGRTRLLRMTLRQARAVLPGEQFIQIHRSVIVNRERIATVTGRRSVEMADGTSFTVGDAHRSNLPEL
jgi:hypothetical protein